MASIERRRVVVLVLVLGLLAAGGVADVTVHGGRAARNGPINLIDSVARPSSSIVSSAWYCAGPLPVGKQSESSELAVTNISARRVEGTLTVADARGTSTTNTVRFDAHSSGVVSLPKVGARDFAGATLLVDGAGLGVFEVVHRPQGTTSAPCQSHVSTVGYLPTGSTSGTNNIELSIYDPGATPSVVSVSFATENGPKAPPALQGIPIAAGKIVTVNVAHAVPNTPLVSTFVTAIGGRIVAGASELGAVSSSPTMTLATMTSGSADTAYLTALPSGPLARRSMDIFNPSSRAADVAVEFAGPGGVATEDATVAAGASVSLVPSSDVTAESFRYARLNVKNSVGVVASSQTTLTGRIVPAAVHLPKGSTRPTLPILAKGVGTTSAVNHSYADWILAGESDASTSTAVTVANPGTKATEVVIKVLTDGTTRTLGEYGVAANSVLVIDLAPRVGTHPSFGVVVSATTPVVAGDVLYARGSSGSIGFSASAGIPLG